MEWIKTNDELPEDNVEVTVFSISNGVSRGFHASDDASGTSEIGWNVIAYEDPIGVSDVTHWMPLPSPPQD